MFYAVTIKDLDTDEKYKVIVEGEEWKNEYFKDLERRVAILRAIEDVAYKIADRGDEQFIKASRHIYRKVRGYDNFIKKLKSDLNIKVKAKAI